jgi:hypothetical protein
MFKLTQATFTLFGSIALTAFVLALALPSHVRGGGETPDAVPGIQHALVTEVVNPRVADASDESSCPALPPAVSGSSCPYLERRAPQDGHAQHVAPKVDATSASECPYLSGQAARAGCPAPTTRGDRSACPYLSGKDGVDGHPRDGAAAELPREVHL